MYTVSALFMAVVLAAGVLALGGRRELGDIAAALVLVVLLLAAPAPLALLHSLRLQHDSALASIEQEMRAQQVLLHRVIPSVFVDALVHDRKTTSPPMPDISVMFVEVMVLAADGRSPPRKLGSNMQGDTLDILSHVFKILDRVVSQNGGECCFCGERTVPAPTTCARARVTSTLPFLHLAPCTNFLQFLKVRPVAAVLSVPPVLPALFDLQLKPSGPSLWPSLVCLRSSSTMLTPRTLQW